MIKVLEHDNFSPSHNKVVFADKGSASDMNNAIGRFDENNQTIAFINDRQSGTKYRALFESGFDIWLSKSANGNYFIETIETVISENKPPRESHTHLNAYNESLLDTDTVEYVDYDSFALNEANTTGMVADLDFTHSSLSSTHTVGHVTPDGKFTLRPDIAKLISSDFTIIQDDTDGFDIDTRTLTGREVLNIAKFLQRYEINEDIDCVNVAALTQVRKLLGRIRLEQKHGLADDMKNSIDELNEILMPYENASPPAEGLDSVRAALDSIISNDNDIVAESIKWLSNQGRFL